ncbi:DUF6231 family protein [Aurantivibrio plasticivorans]
MERFNDWQTAAIATISAQLPTLNKHQILLISPEPSATLKQWCEKQSLADKHIALDVTHIQSLEETSALSENFALALIHSVIDEKPKSQSQMLLGRCHNLLASRVWLTVTAQSAWTLSDFLALGFKRVSTIENPSGDLTCFGYDLATYNHKRKWNNPQYWANPENWNKFRW